MSTRSLIGILNKDRSVTHIYCHWDGYPSNNGKILTEHYTSFDKIQELLKLGDLSVLGEEIGVKHPFETYNLPDEEQKKYEGMCFAYGRDRGEKGVRARKSKSIEAYKKYFTESDRMILFLSLRYYEQRQRRRQSTLRPLTTKESDDD